MAVRLKNLLLWRMCLGCVGVVWFISIVYMSWSVNKSDSETRPLLEEDELSKVLAELNRLENENVHLKNLADELSTMKRAIMHQQSRLNVNKESRTEMFNVTRSHVEPLSERFGQERVWSPDSKSWSPSLRYELMRRKTETDVIELWNFVQNKLMNTKQACESKDSDLALSHVQSMLNFGTDIQRTVQVDLYNLSLLSDEDEWRLQESMELSRLVQSRLRALQNPKTSCDKTKRLVCTMNKGCGYGCQLHHVAYCLIVAYGTGRTMVLDSKAWRYSPNGWDKFFRPVSKCRFDTHDLSVMWSANTMDSKVVVMPIIDSINPRPPFLPQAIPSSIAERLVRLHGHPFVWWLGQLLYYIVRPQPSLLADIKDTTAKIGFKGPIVGVHVRRTDKVGLEAAYHSLDEYMEYVEEYFNVLAMRLPHVKRRIYLASDDPEVIKEARDKYTQYEIICDSEFSKTAGMKSRYTEVSLRAVIFDIHFLSQTDYLVCTFSSQVCRLAYELMQTRFPDASRFFKSLDDIFYYGGQDHHSQRAIIAHTAKSSDEISLKVGDYIGIAGNHWNGYSKGTNRRTGAVGLYPSYKAVDVVKVEDFKFDENFDES